MNRASTECKWINAQNPNPLRPPVSLPTEIRIAWTTVETEADARSLAAGLVEAGLVACAQISAPITSIYSWKGEIHEATEYRITLKFPERTEQAILHHLETMHPYEVPQWVSVSLDCTHPGYAAWVEQSTPTKSSNKQSG